MTPEKRADLRTGPDRAGLSTEAILAWLHQFPTLDVPTDGRDKKQSLFLVPLHDILPNATIVEIMTCRDSI